MRIQSTLFTTALFVPKYYDVKLNFCCNEFKFKLNWYIWANTTDVLKNFAVIKNVAIKSFHCMSSEGFGKFVHFAGMPKPLLLNSAISTEIL